MSFIPKGKDSQASMETDEERSISPGLSKDGREEIVSIVAEQRHDVDFSPLRPRGKRGVIAARNLLTNRQDIVSIPITPY